MPTLHDAIEEAKMIRVSHQIVDEMVRQVVKWGIQDHPMWKHDDIFGLATLNENLDEDVLSTSTAKFICDTRLGAGECSWQDILNEEVLEARDEAIAGNAVALREELIQIAAVAASAILSLDRSTNRCEQCGLLHGGHKMSCTYDER